MSYFNATIKLKADGSPTVDHKDIPLSKSKGPNQIRWTIKAGKYAADDVFIILIKGDGCFGNEGGRKKNAYIERIKSDGVGEIRSKVLRKSVAIRSKWKYIIVRIKKDATKVWKTDPRISIQS